MPADNYDASNFTADPGTYTLHMSGEKIENPDLLATWTITQPPPKH